MKKSFFMLLFAAFIGFAANAQTQKTSTAPASKPATTTQTAKPATATSTAQSPKPAALNIPEAVASGFKAKYATATAPIWKMKGANYLASFKMNNEEMKAEFDNTGKWLQTENKIATTSLPATVQSEIKKDFADYKTEDAHKLTSATTGAGYTAKLAKGTEKYEVTFGADGKMISKTKV